MASSPRPGIGVHDGAAAMLEVEDINKRFGGLSVLSGISFDVPAGTIPGLIGPNGAGKTTLFNIVTGFVPPDAGAVRFNTHNITRFAPERRAGRGIARTSQLVKSFNRLTVLENVMVGAFAIENDPALARQRALAALERVGLSSVGHLRP